MICRNHKCLLSFRGNGKTFDNSVNCLYLWYARDFPTSSREQTFFWNREYPIVSLFQHLQKHVDTCEKELFIKKKVKKEKIFHFILFFSRAHSIVKKKKELEKNNERKQCVNILDIKSQRKNITHVSSLLKNKKKVRESLFMQIITVNLERWKLVRANRWRIVNSGSRYVTSDDKFLTLFLNYLIIWRINAEIQMPI